MIRIRSFVSARRGGVSVQALMGIVIGAGIAFYIWKATYRKPQTMHETVTQLQAVNDKMDRMLAPYKERMKDE